MRAPLLIFLLVPYIALAGGRQEVSREQLGDAWPFTVDKGEVACRGISSVVFITERKVYAVNGQAIGEKRYADVREIWLDSPVPGKYSAPKRDLGPMIRMGLDLCD